jgi:hypothetical protein
VPQFPVLKTGAVAQYPSARTETFSTRALRFVDGAEQRYRLFASPLHRWHIRLDLLDEAELAAIDEFFVANGGRAGVFSFTDPWDGTAYPNCSFDHDELAAEALGPGRGRTVLTIKENR